MNFKEDLQHMRSESIIKNFFEEGSNAEKQQHVKRLENLANETKLENKKKYYLDKIKEVKGERTKIFNQLIFIQKEIDSNKAEIEVLDNFFKFTEGLAGNSTNKQFEKAKLTKRSFDVFVAATQVQKDKLRREKESQDLKEDIIRKYERKEILKEKEKELKKSINELKEELTKIKNQLMTHYHTLLNEGRDTRQEGLVWIIKAIWNLGHNVIMSYMPSYLDEKGIEFLFDLAHKDFDLQKIKASIEELKLDLRLSVFKDKMTTRRIKKPISENTFKTTIKVVNIFK